MEHIIANYKKEQQAFCDLLEMQCKERILLFQGSSGVGKTTLLRTCLSVARENDNFQCITLDFKSGTIEIVELLYQLGESIEWERLSNFKKTTEYYLKQTSNVDVNLNSNWLFGMKNHLQVILPTADANNRKMVLLELTKALFQDLKLLKQPLLFVFDTYENAVQEVKDWIFQSFLTAITKNAQLRVLIAGQNTPDTNNIQWGHCCLHRPLNPDCKAEDWLPVLKALNKRIPISNLEPLQALELFCYSYRNQPDSIRKLIDNFPCCE
jgi:ATP/maltotriose-dependent transcriptional regulator MalT